MITGIILAGGKSERATTNKMALLINGEPLIRNTISCVRPFADKLVVVTGRYHKELLPLLKDVEVVYNANYEKGMFSSVKAGVAKAEGNFFIIPGDCPFVSKDTFTVLQKSSFLVRVPTYEGKTGHPIYFDESIKKKILGEDINSNLKKVRDENGYQTIEVDDSNILNDVDTLLDYQMLKDKMERK